MTPFVDMDMWGHLSLRTVIQATRHGMARTLACLLALSALTLTALPASFASAQLRARTARALRATDSAKLHCLQNKSSGSRLFEEGAVTGTLPGNMHLYANIGPTLTATFTIFTSHGTIVGHASATPHGSGRYESFGGTLTATGGTGQYRHAHGHGGFFGVLDRHTYNMTVQTTGTLSY
jgi:hypothetical protein